MEIGILSLQGGVAEHIKHIEALGSTAIEVRKLEDLEGIDGLILPGGESTAIGKILKERDMLDSLRDKIQAGLPTWGTCAGMILLAKEMEEDTISYLGVIDIRVKRNAYGRQINSFSTVEIIEEVSSDPIPLIFIRAPYITRVGEGVRIIHKVKDNVVAAVQRNILVSSFHPELTGNLEFHKYFLNMCEN